MPILHNLYIRPVARIFPAEVSPISPVNLCPFPFHHPIPSPPFTVILAQVPLLQCIFSFFLPIILSLYSSYIEGPGNRFYLSSPAVVRAKISTYLCQISRKSVQGFLLQSETLKFSQWENRVNKTCQYFHGGGTAHPYGRVKFSCEICHFCQPNFNVCRCNTAVRLQKCVESGDWSKNKVMASSGDRPRRSTSTPFPRRGETSPFAVCPNGRVGRLFSVECYILQLNPAPGSAVIGWCFALKSIRSVVADPLNFTVLS